MSAELLDIYSEGEQNFVTSLIADKKLPFVSLTMNKTLNKLVLII
jgi:hypothetical protein